ncbi:ACP S-malonyltransferase [Candidatus Methylacidiphilum infernorum]|uniref:Malonyl CoA-acyl carrier protein transacylase n=1 Tax=Candidatus Methylacidiphilum infernorum TaxID=511746 RepID=A0ABX7PUR3_9BACT|nr:ACP S-malonyltransferase [Candidatus Methylacidiphilum infernorum]QSR86321.1 ACP S-malonyltransferase [Candidatus Methylacidiphilum infernorum]
MRIGLLFCGQGAQKVGMGKDFFEHYPLAKDLYLEADKHLHSPLSQLSFHGPQDELAQTLNCQPSLFVFGYTVFRILHQEIKGIDILGMGGLSLGELTAYAAAGSFDFFTGLKLVKQRARLIHEASEKNPGKMVALIGSSRKQAESIAARSSCEVANYNSPDQQVLSGSAASITKAVELAHEEGIKKVIPLEVSGPFHSSFMEEPSRSFYDILKEVDLKMPSVPVVTNLRASPARDVDEIRYTLSKQICKAVLWEESLHFMLDWGIELFIEVSPRKIFGNFLKKIAPHIRCFTLSNVESINELKNEL